ncbi:DegT/DnrJ/EryC1/StrS family aminotransferase [archaeon]|nr:MAG: DegT/DnrJ/EryC1/StrS family aminotransferase [archaeon]
MKIPMSLPFFDGNEKKLINEVIDSKWVSRGEKLARFEADFRNLMGMKYALAVSNGTAALHLAMLGLNIGNGDEVITTPFSFVSSANAALFVGAKPVFVDIDERMMNIDTSRISDAINDKTKAILPVHVFGQPCDMDSIMKIADGNDMMVIEDAAEALGSEYKGRKVGTFGKVSTFSFMANKQFTTGEGGMLTMNDESVFNLCWSLKNLGKVEHGGRFVHDMLGYNYHINEISCAMGIAQLAKFDFVMQKRQQLFDEYTKRLKNVDGVILPHVDNNNKYSWLFYVIRLKDGIDRNDVSESLKEFGIDNRAYFSPPIHLEKLYKERFNYKEGDFPVTEKVSKTNIALPFFPDLKMNELEFVVEKLESAIQSA